MARNSKLLAVTLASLLVLATFAPGALAATAANAAANTSVDVSTEAATDVTAEGATLNGNVTELNGSENATVAFQYWVEDDSENATTVEVGELPGEGTFGATLDGLSANTTYVYVATAEAGNATAVGAEQTFTTLEALSVSVETGGAANVTATNATFEGELTAVEGVENASVSFRYYEEGDRSTTEVLALGEQSEGNFSAAVSDLSPNTTYVVVAQAEAERGNETADATGASVNFTTADATQPLGVETANATDVTNASATLNGELTGLNGSENASVSFEYWTVGDRENTSDTTTAVDLDAPGSFSAAVGNLSGNTTYVYVAQAEAGNDTVTGEQVEFTTQPDVLPLGVETTNATDVTNDSATLGGDLTGLNGSDDANVSFEFWTEGDAANATTIDAGNLSAAESFSAGVSGLQNNTTYVYVAQAEAGNDTVTGDEETFTAGAVEQEDEGFVPPNGPFGQQVVAFIDYMRNAEDGEERNLGQAISNWVTANNPGADNRPDHAGPPEDRGPSADGEDDDKERGPPEDKERGPPEDKERGPPEDKERGPPEDKGPNADDDDAETDEESDSEDDSEEDEEDEDDEEDDDKGGPPEHAGPK